MKETKGNMNISEAERIKNELKPWELREDLFIPNEILNKLEKSRGLVVYEIYIVKKRSYEYNRFLCGGFREI